jgi:hypothetical protein
MVLYPAGLALNAVRCLAMIDPITYVKNWQISSTDAPTAVIRRSMF